jgi:hypothetical protein
MKSSNGREHSHLGCLEAWLLVALIGLFPWSKYFNLSDMSVPSTMLILQYCKLNRHSLDVGFEDLPIHPFLLELECKPPNRLLKVNVFHLLQLIETIPDSDRYL